MSENREMLKQEILNMLETDPARCMVCGKCTATCPAYDAMEYHPHQIVGMVNRNEFPELEKIVESTWACMSCMACSERCPRDVQPARVMEAVRQMAIRRQNGNHLTPEQIPGMIDPELPQQAITSAFRKYRK